MKMNIAPKTQERIEHSFYTFWKHMHFHDQRVDYWDLLYECVDRYEKLQHNDHDTLRIVFVGYNYKYEPLWNGFQRFDRWNTTLMIEDANETIFENIPGLKHFKEMCLAADEIQAVSLNKFSQYIRKSATIWYQDIIQIKDNNVIALKSTPKQLKFEVDRKAMRSRLDDIVKEVEISLGRQVIRN